MARFTPGPFHHDWGKNIGRRGSVQNALYTKALGPLLPQNPVQLSLAPQVYPARGGSTSVLEMLILTSLCNVPVHT